MPTHIMLWYSTFTQYIHTGQTEMLCSHLGNAYSILRTQIELLGTRFSERFIIQLLQDISIKFFLITFIDQIWQFPTTKFTNYRKLIGIVHDYRGFYAVFKNWFGSIFSLNLTDTNNIFLLINISRLCGYQHNLFILSIFFFQLRFKDRAFFVNL